MRERAFFVIVSLSWLCIACSASSASTTQTALATDISGTYSPSPVAPPTYMTNTALPLTATPSVISATADNNSEATVSARRTAVAVRFLPATATHAAMPTPTIPAGAALCTNSDLSGEVVSQGATGSLDIGAKYTNTSTKVCVLQGPPHILLVNHLGKALDIDYDHFCATCPDIFDLDRTPLPATQIAATAISQQVAYTKKALQPGETIYVSLHWSNWCGPITSSQPVYELRLILSSPKNHLDVPLDRLGGSRCDAPEERSGLGESEFIQITPVSP